MRIAGLAHSAPEGRYGRGEKENRADPNIETEPENLFTFIDAQAFDPESSKRVRADIKEKDAALVQQILFRNPHE